MRPHTYRTMSEEQLAVLVDSPALFARKVAGDCEGSWRHALHALFTSGARTPTPQERSSAASAASAAPLAEPERQ